MAVVGKTLVPALLGAAALTLMALPGQAQVKIAYIDPLSGAMAPIGEGGVKHFNFMIDRINAKGGVNGQKLELVTYDNKLSPQESIVAAQKAIDAGIRIITQGNGSGVAAALIDFVNKHNERNPGKEVVYLNYAAVDPAFTNDKCSYWHFRWDAHADVKMAALTSYMKDNSKIKKVYLINQDYSFGQAVRKSATEMLKAKRPDIQIVGDELHPLAKVTDFSPYVAKIKASGADSVITGNWGSDIALLLKAAADAGLQVDWYTYYAGGAGGPTAIKQTGLKDRVYAIVEGGPNHMEGGNQAFEEEFRKKANMGVWYPRVRNQMEMLARAMNEAKSNDPKVFAEKLRGMKYTNIYGSATYMRAEDHQFFQDMFIEVFTPIAEAKLKYDEEGTGWGWKTAATVKMADTDVPTTCKMAKPS
ncbi:branched-chain amino acid ABC transporter substrate-binding protein [Ferrovibrio sp.]|uniref:branched-chain amino acid ABC transporter substrate-binding protein n=1 Tax=Ferrovibrio sp. TaxID=1917215 RepID=UPI003D278B2C